MSVNGKASTLEDVLHVEQYNSGRYSSSVFKNRYGEYFHGDSSHNGRIAFIGTEDIPMMIGFIIFFQII